MSLLLAGLVLFLGVHLLPTAPAVRTALAGRLGDRGYRGAFSLASLAGIVLIAVGFAHAPREPRLFAPVGAAIAAAPYAVTVALVLFAAANMPTHIRHALRHPMLLGLLLWAVVHLLANGDLRGTVMFGAFALYAIVDLASAIGRHAVKAFDPQAKFDAMAIVGGVVVALVVMTLHRLLFGVGVVPFSI